MYRTVAQLAQLTADLASYFPQLVTRMQLPEPSVEGRPVFAVKVRAGRGGPRRGVLLVAGTHSRELMNPDMLAELVVDLVVSYLTGTDVVLGGRTWSALDVRVILETLDLYVVPCTNPDGRNYVMTVDGLWRKNRRVNSGTSCMGVDLNRNLDVLWGVISGQVSCSPCADTYCGATAFSEPETRNVKHLLDEFPIDCFADVHSYSELVLYPWGHAPSQTTNPAMNFTTLPTGTCQPIAVKGYAEYISPRDELRFTTVASRIGAAIAPVRGRVYTAETGFALYGTTGTHIDYVYSRHLANTGLRKVYGYTMETGPYAGNLLDSFHPANPDPIKEEAESGVIALVQQCICAIELIGERFLDGGGGISSLRRVRDELLGSTGAGREWIALFERVQTAVIPILLTDEALGRQAAGLVSRAVALVADESAVLDRELLAEARSFVAEVGDRLGSRAHRRDLAAVAATLDALTAQSSAQAVARLMARPPHEERSADQR
jgi:murein tripeptide amidase MpaA